MKPVSFAALAAVGILAACAQQEEIVVIEEPVVAAPATQYTVYFGFDSAALTELGAETVGTAAAAAMTTASSSISVIGHTDTVGSAAYNQGLSERRAATVSTALVGEGVNPAIITSAGRSETELAVATADNVREPRNRRVEITLN